MEPTTTARATARATTAELAGAEPAAPTPARSWTTIGLYTLPGSGNVAKLKKVTLIALAAAGAIPNDILQLIALDTPAERLSQEAQLAQYRKNAKAFVAIAERCLVEPRLVTDRAPDYDAGEIGPEDLADRDYTWIFYSFVSGGAADVATFRVS